MRPVHRLSAAIVALMAVTLSATPVASASDWTTYKQSGTRATASTETCADNADGTVTCSGEVLDVFEGTTRSSGLPTEKGEQICYSQFTSTFDPRTGEGTGHGEFGCAIGGTSVSIDGLSSVVLAPTTIELVHVECDVLECTEGPDGTITVNGTWTGTGQIFSQKGKFRSDDGTCMQISADKAQSREASFDGSIDASWANLGEGSFTFRSDCSH